MKKASQVYQFNRVFQDTTSQADFFKETTLPLVENALLHAQTGLLFSYGVSNSGKTYSIQGKEGNQEQERGIIPRTIDIIFNSVDGLECKRALKVNGQSHVTMTSQSEDEYIAPEMLTDVKDGDGRDETSK